jgi:DNA repair protein SbcD/Mre11
MKILHTADWHLGKIVNEFSLLDDQVYIIEKFFHVIELEQPDAVIISGDIYDRSIPPKEAVELLDKTLTRLIEDYHIPTFIISGNHDSQERLSFGNKLLEHKNLYIVGTIQDEIKKVTLQDTYGNINFYLMPYIHPSYARHLFNDDTLTEHNKVMEYCLDHFIDLNTHERNILINHNFIAPINEQIDADTSESERSLSIGGAEVVDVNLVKLFDYVALGHLHKPQKIKYDHVRYSGSLLKYSFSEVGYDKGVMMIELKDKQNINYHFIALEPIRNMIKIKGTLEELTDASFYRKINQQDYICAVLTNEEEVYDPLSRLRAVYPNLMQIEKNNFLINVEGNYKAQGNFKEKSEIELFEEFYQAIVDKELGEDKRDIVIDILEDVIKGEGK